MTQPTIIAVTPAKNEQAAIMKSIRSVLEQTLPVALHVVVDDCSEDDTVRIVQSIPDHRVRLISSNIPKAAKQHGARPHLVEQVGLDEATRLMPDWEYGLKLDGDCWLPTNYLRTTVLEMERNQRLVMAGARYLQTPTRTETASSEHVRNSNHVIKRRFYDACAKRGRNYATLHGEILLERQAFTWGLKVRSLPNLTAYCGRETGVTVADSLIHGQHDYQLGTPLFLLLMRMRKPSCRLLRRITGWLMASYRRDQRYLTEAEIKSLNRHYWRRFLGREQECQKTTASKQ